MFQLFATKQVFNVATVLDNLMKQKEYAHLGKECPSCTMVMETTGHVLLCPELGRQQNQNRQLTFVQQWLRNADTHPVLTLFMSQFLFTRGTMIADGQICHTPEDFATILSSLQSIGWR